MASREWKPNALRWRLAPADPAAEGLGRQLGTSPLVAQVLLNRGLADPDAARAFLEPKLSQLHAPEDLPGCAAAARRLAEAVRAGQRICLYGDYDVDGITGVAILHSLLAEHGADVLFYVPHRLEEGYGLNARAVRKLAGRGAKLLVTVDCGVTAVEPVAAARAAGMDVIVTDHHALGPALPDAAAIVHPALPGSTYPNPHLAGAGVAFKLAWQLARQLGAERRVDPARRRFLLDATCLAGLGTIADVVPLLGENRALAAAGLLALPATEHPGLRALIDSAGLAGDKLDAFHVGFCLAPRLNACGRMGHAKLAVELLTAADPARCRQIADYLARQNALRQEVQRRTAAEAVALAEQRGLDRPDARAIVLAGDDWHGGVIGIVASRLVDRYARPTVLIARNGQGGAQGSCRSVPGFHMRDALAACSGRLLSFGGHAMAAGLRIDPAEIDAFAADFAAHAAATLTDEQLTPALDIDAEGSLAELDYNGVSHLARLAPFGQGNPRPVVALRGCEVAISPRRMGRGGQTVGLTLRHSGATVRAVGFGMGDLADLLADIRHIDVAAEPRLNTFRGRTNVELHLRDVKW